MKKFGIGKFVLFFIEVLLVLLTFNFVIGYINFNKISHNDNCFMLRCDDSYYNSDSDKISVCRGFIYKIVKVESENKGMRIKLKLWFDSNE